LGNSCSLRADSHAAPPRFELKDLHDGAAMNRSYFFERTIERFLAACGFLTIAVTCAIIYVLVSESAAFFSHVSFADFFLDTQWTPLFAEKHFGIWPLVTGTLLTALIAMAVALPTGLLAAIYLSQFCPKRVRSILKPALEVLAGIPTLVYGYFALIVLTPILQSVIPSLAGFNALSPGLIMGVMIVPMIASLSEDALRAVPNELREGAWALGADPFKTTLRVVVPAAFSGIAASVILALSRAIGETMIVAIAAGQQPRLGFDPTKPVETMTAYIVQVALGDTPADSPEFRSIFAVGAILFVMTFATNLASQLLTRRFRAT
jgi:phosphate transport system permease protein